ncbi:hypothetical protein [Halalkalibacter oceani]|uniref:hypothetical protein n=1 Tax=Halalkalibacter oceani TaxID=1653776 RepID=UPI003393AEF2
MNNYNKPEAFSQEQINKIMRLVNADMIIKLELSNNHCIDDLLDKYNDYMTLYKMFGDKSYFTYAMLVMVEIKNKYS